MAQFAPPYGYYDVTDPAYGAPHDGVGDAAPGIQAAESAAEATGGVVFFPPGQYRLISAGLAINNSKVRWQGAGAGASTIIMDAVLGTRTAMLQVAAGLSDIELCDLTFQGNGLPPGQPGYVQPYVDLIAFGTLSGNPLTRCAVRNCYFTQTKSGPTLHFYGVTDGEVEGCRFFAIGYNDARHGEADITPGVQIGSRCVDFRIHNNHFEQCNQTGVRVAGTACDVSSNYFLDCIASAINVGINPGDAKGARVFGNYAENTAAVTATDSNQAIYIQAVYNYQVIGNTVKATQGDGIAGGDSANGVYIGNVAFNNASVASADCGIQYVSQAAGSSPNQSVGFVGNVGYEDGTKGAQKYAIRMLEDPNTPGGAVHDFVLLGNTGWGNVNGQGFESDIQAGGGVMENSDQAFANSSTWLDRQHKGYKSINSQSKVSLVTTNPVVGPTSMNQSTGLRIVAGGTTSSGVNPSNKTFYLGLGSSANLMPAQSVGPMAADWQLEAYVINDGSYSSQHGFVHFYYDGILVFAGSSSTSVATDQQVSVLLEGAVGDPGDSIKTNFLSVERV